MSNETTEWLNNNVLIGFIDDKMKWADQPYAISGKDADGNTIVKPWFADEDYTGGYPGPIPIEAVQAKLLDWQAIESPIYGELPTDIGNADTISADGTPVKRLLLPDRKAIVRSDNGHCMGVFKDGYTVHQYEEWLLDNVATILDDDDLAIGSAMLLDGGGICAVTVELPEGVSGKAGLEMRTRMLNYTSHTGRFSTTYMLCQQIACCDNSLQVEIDGKSKDSLVKVKHSTRSMGKVDEVRGHLGLIYEHTEQMVEFFDKLSEWEVSNKDYLATLDQIVPVPDEVKDEKGKVTNKRGITMADNKRLEITKLYAEDFRASQWAGTALGVLQAFNTYDQWVKDIRGGSQRVERQTIGTISGDVQKFDQMVLTTLADVTGKDMTELVVAS